MIERAYLMPCKVPPHKDTLGVAQYHRLAMLDILCNAYPQLAIESIELSLPAPSFTVKTLAVLREREPDQQINFIIGYDSWCNLATWHEWQRLIELCNIIVLPRECTIVPTATSNSMAAAMNGNYGFQVVREPDSLLQLTQGCVFFAPTECVTISSTEIRQLLTQYDTKTQCSINDSRIDKFLHPSVFNYITKHGLYQNKRG